MARMPGAVWKPMPGSSTTPMASYDVLCVHTMVGSLTGTDSWFRSQANGLNSHFGVGPNGEIWQWVDTAYRSGASYNGNYHLISVECADTGAPFPAWTGSDVPAFTAAQIAALGSIAAWVHDTHGIPLVQIPDALPTRRGVGYHRLGVPGYMVAGAEQWSTALGKVCPGDRRIAQIPQVIAAATGGFLMALTDAEQTEMLSNSRQIRDYLGANGGGGTKTENTVGYKVNDVQSALTKALPVLVNAAQTPAPAPGAVVGTVSLSDADRAAIVADVVAAIKELRLS